MPNELTLFGVLYRQEKLFRFLYGNHIIIVRHLRKEGVMGEAERIATIRARGLLFATITASGSAVGGLLLVHTALMLSQKGWRTHVVATFIVLEVALIVFLCVWARFYKKSWEIAAVNPESRYFGDFASSQESRRIKQYGCIFGLLCAAPVAIAGLFAFGNWWARIGGLVLALLVYGGIANWFEGVRLHVRCTRCGSTDVESKSYV